MMYYIHFEIAVILAIWLALIAAIYSRIAPSSRLFQRGNLVTGNQEMIVSRKILIIGRWQSILKKGGEFLKSGAASVGEYNRVI